MINIIMPTYNAHDTIRQAIASVCMQDNINDILLTIVDDCSEKPYDYLLKDYNYIDMEILRKNENTGCGQSRQYGIDRTKGEYLMFLDADDCFYAPNSVKILYNFIKSENLDFVNSDFIEETINGDYLIHENDSIWMHGKIYKTEFIKQKNLKFNFTRGNEDHPFNGMVLSCGAKSRYINYTSYVWKYNKNSTTRKDDFFYNSMPDYFINAKYFVTELADKNIDQEKTFNIIKSYLLTMYGYYNIFLVQQRSHYDLKNFLDNVKDFYYNIPQSIIPDISVENIKFDFYSHPVINNLLCDNVLFGISIYDFINTIKFSESNAS